MLVPFRLARSAPPAVALTVVLSLAACGEGDGSKSRPREAEAARSAGDLRAIKRYLLDHTERLKRDTAEIRRGAEAYYRLAKAANFDYERLLRTNRRDVRQFVTQAQAAFRRANASYEEMEGVVAGVPELARLRRDHRRGRRRQQSRERRPVRHARASSTPPPVSGSPRPAMPSPLSS
jgi:hypothetical protein